MWVRADLGTTGPQGPLQDSHNGSPRPDAIAGIPTRNRDALDQGTDTLAAAPQSIHQSPRDGNCKRPQQSPPQWVLDGTWPPGKTLKSLDIPDNVPIVAYCSIRIKEVINQLTGLWGQYCSLDGEQ
ncbi:hypothetical protein WMY93_027427 [Mugilogobius chulae]|uniref:Uncharacterized protein n=1 Tax=Mugilogobius chulae TaxID=88201 RepID=A0AAW0MSV7_9GOBI